jgi:hypothetical protein
MLSLLDCHEICQVASILKFQENTRFFSSRYLPPNRQINKSMAHSPDMMVYVLKPIVRHSGLK